MVRSPLFPFVALALFSIFSAALILTLALRQPWFGAELTAPPDGPGVILSGVEAGSALAALPLGTRVLSVAPADAPGQAVELRGIDRMEEPDGLPDIAAMNALFAHQGALHRVISGGAVVFATDTGPLTAAPAQGRPLSDLPDTFWIQIVTGLVGCWLGGWVLALRRREASAAYLALAGVSLAVSAHAAALYSTREIALPADLFYWASAFNTLGAIVFGVGMICLFLVYPVRIVPRWVVALAFAVFGTWAVLAFLRLTVSTQMMIHVPIVVEMSLILLLALAQVVTTRGQPRARAALRWFGLSVALGAGSFVVLITAPQALGFTPQVKQGHAFAGFILIYVGLAIGVARYRLFELEDWSFRLFFYVGGVVLLIVLDVALIYFVALDRVPAFSLALLAVVFLYLPARDWIGRVLSRRNRLDEETLFDLVSRAALAAPGADQQTGLRDLLQALFNPAEIAPAPGPVDQPTIRTEGEAMDIPGLDRAPALRMRWANGGRRLFSPADARRAARVLDMAEQLLERRRAYEDGAAQERRRINRDIRDNIGIHLLGALHSDGSDRKGMLVRQALTDLRDIVSNTEGTPRKLDELLADLRAEAHALLDAADIALDWAGGGREAQVVDAQITATLRAVVREAVNNIVRHAGAKTVTVRIAPSGAAGERLSVRVWDDGNGPCDQAAPTRAGQGLINLRQRAEAHGGSLDFGPGPGGGGAILEAEIVTGAAPALPSARSA